MRRLRSAADVVTTGRRSARLEGFSLHAAVAVPARRRDQLERLCRYLLRPPLAGERLTESTGGQRLYHFRRPWRDGSTALLLDPVELLARVAALVPPPQRPLLAYLGASRGTGRIVISDGRLVVEGARGLRGVGTVLRNPAGDVLMKIEGTLADNSTLSATLWPTH